MQLQLEAAERESVVPVFILRLIDDCRNVDPSARPTFSEIERRIWDDKSPRFDHDDDDHDSPALTRSPLPDLEAACRGPSRSHGVVADSTASDTTGTEHTPSVLGVPPAASLAPQAASAGSSRTAAASGTGMTG